MKHESKSLSGSSGWQFLRMIDEEEGLLPVHLYDTIRHIVKQCFPF